MCSVGWGRSRTFLTCVTEEAKVQSPSGTVFPEDTAIAWPKPPCAAAWDGAVTSYLVLSASALAPPAAGVIVLHWESCPFLAQTPLTPLISCRVNARALAGALGPSLWVLVTDSSHLLLLPSLILSSYTASLPFLLGTLPPGASFSVCLECSS